MYCMKIKKILAAVLSALALTTCMPVMASEATPAAESVSIPQDVTVYAQAGVGDSVITFSLPAGAYKVHLIHDGKSNFAVWCHNNGNKDLLVNTIGAYDGYTALLRGNTDAYNNAMLEIKADGNWIVVIDQIVATSTSTLFGTGDKVTGLIQGNGTNNIVSIINANSNSNFSIWAYSLDGTDKELLANTIGDYTGQTVFDMKLLPYYLVIHSDGAWSIDFGRGEALTIVGGTPENTVTQTTPTASESVSEQPTASLPGNYVWISATGNKYHAINNCGKMNPNKASLIPYEDAVKMGLSKCSKCY